MSRVKKTTVCPLGGVGIGGKWMFWIWYHLLSGTKRFGELQRLVPEASRQMLTLELRQLEQVGVLRRQVYVQVPPKVEYSLTEVGRKAEPIVRQLAAWGQWYGGQVNLEFDWMISLGGRWKFWIWYHLLSGSKRFNELQKLLPKISRQMLALELRELERMKVLSRQAPAHGSLRAEYELTELGRNSGPVLRQLYAWGRWICEELDLEFDWPVLDEAEVRAS
ncbi:HxlR family transcriptional regulator [Ktedonosporobacter rubrisoli]|uniref:HxlR family transcriptional regulator n=1 Tax=Ktedonosporobacter rubrisoli TaxID=2509675 RepID=A0A4P6JMU5_KTERU|nr:winged helix-turn-helix transcriptional regulator [Ktedonosporobacter rubrisoli]QBD76607.1 HxlR family transcriptional regulator [Ktedonosporobacter rubrisoli]